MTEDMFQIPEGSPFALADFGCQSNAARALAKSGQKLKEEDRYVEMMKASDAGSALRAFGLTEEEVQQAFEVWPLLRATMKAADSEKIEGTSGEETGGSESLQKAGGEGESLERIDLKTEVLARLDQLTFLSGGYWERVETDKDKQGGVQTEEPPSKRRHRDETETNEEDDSQKQEGEAESVPPTEIWKPTCSAMTKAEVIKMVREEPLYLARKFQTLLKTKDLIAVNKPFDVRVDIPKAGSHKWSLEVSVADWFCDQCPECERVRLCHQLDHATSGVLILARNKKAAGQVQQTFEQRGAKKEYSALLRGHCKFDKITVEERIAQDPQDDFKMKIAKAPEGRDARTEIEVVRRGYLRSPAAARGQPVTLVRMFPYTGRRHQLRVHSEFVGHSIVGDYEYFGGERLRDSEGKILEGREVFRLCLHAARLQLPVAPPLGPLDIQAPDPLPSLLLD